VRGYLSDAQFSVFHTVAQLARHCFANKQFKC